MTTVPYAPFQSVPIAHLPLRLQEVSEAWMQRQARVLMLPRNRLYSRIVFHLPDFVQSEMYAAWIRNQELPPNTVEVLLWPSDAWYAEYRQADQIWRSILSNLATQGHPGWQAVMHIACVRV